MLGFWKKNKSEKPVSSKRSEKNTSVELSEEELEAITGGLTNEEMVRAQIRKFRVVFHDDHTDNSGKTGNV